MEILDLGAFYAVILAAVATALLLIAVIVLYVRISRKYVQLKSLLADKDIDKNELLKHVDAESQQIMERARNKAQKIINDARLFNSKQESLLETEIKKVSAIYSKQYKESLFEIKNTTENMIQSISKEAGSNLNKSVSDLDQRVSEEIGSFKKQLSQEVEGFRSALGSITEEERRKIAEDFSGLMAEKVKNLDDKILEVVDTVTKEFFRNGLSVDDHEKLIMEALEKAKKEGTFA